MSFFSNFLNLGSTIARNVSGLGDDVFKTKKALGGLGLFSGALNATPDAGLFDSLKAFQKSAGLSVDGLMKPGGPTERGLNSLLQKTGVGERVFSEKAPGQGTDKRDNPSPWFKQARLPQISAEASSSNGRTVGGLLKSSANGKLPLYQADALSSNKDRAFGEYGDFLNQLHARDPGRVAGFEKDVMERLPSATKAKLATYFNQTAEAKPASSNRRSLLIGDGGKDDLSGAGAKPTGQTKIPPKNTKDDVIFRKLRGNLGSHEGGYADRPPSDDPGGPTLKGMSQQQLEIFRKLPEWQNLPENSKDLTDNQIDAIYRKEYFDKPQIGTLSKVPGLKEAAPNLAGQVFDAGALHGPGDAGRWLQESLDEELGTDIRVIGEDGGRFHDGIIGSDTRKTVERAVREGKIEAINNRIVDKRIEHMRSLSNFKGNKNGWLVRAESFRIKPRR